LLAATGPASVGGTYTTCEGTRTFTYHFVDCEGNNHDWVYTYTIEREDFTLSTANGSSTVACIGLATQPAAPTVNDNCGNAISPVLQPLTGTYAGCEGTRIYTFRYTDCEGNTHDWTYTYTIERNDFTMPGNQSSNVTCISQATDPGAPAVNDNCGNALSATGVATIGGTFNGCSGTRTFTYHFVDCEGNNHDWVYTYNVNDNIPPTFTFCPSNASRASNTVDCKYSIVGTEFNAAATDNCGGAVTYSYNLGGATTGSNTGSLAGVVLNAGITTITWTASDGCGNNNSTCSFTVNVAGGGGAMTIGCQPAVTTYAWPFLCFGYANLDEPTATAGCGGTIVSISNNHPSGFYPVGTTVVTWTALDSYGHTITCQQSVIVQDTQDPWIDCPSDKTVNAPTNQCSATVSIGSPDTWDNCGVASVTNNHPSSTYPVGSTVVTWTVTDVNGNTRTCSQTITVVDNQKPTINCLANVNVNAAAGLCSATVNLTTPGATDNCGIASVTSDHPSNVYPVGTTTVTWTATDIHGNTKTCTQNVTVNDTQSPVFAVCPSNISQSITSGSNCYKVISAPNPTVTDNCGVTRLNWVMTGATTGSDNSSGIHYVGTQNFNPGVTTIVYTAKDAAGHSVTCTFTVTVTDNFAPVFTTCPSNISQSITSGSNCYKSINPPNPVVTDNCSVTRLNWVMSGATSGSNSSTGINYVGSQNFNTGVTTIVYTAKDAAGNTSTCTFTVTVVDDKDPTVNCPGNMNVTGTTCTKSIPTTNPTYSDNCGVTSFTWVMTGATTGSGSGNVGSRIFNVGVTTITYTVMDAAGNTGTCSFTVTYKESQNPTVNCPSSVNLNTASGVCTANYTVAIPTFSDNCGVTTLTWSMSGVTSGSSGSTGMNYVGNQTYNKGVTTITYTAKDASGNSATCSFTVTVKDMQAPTITSCPPNTTFCKVPSKNYTVAQLAATDNCGSVTVTYVITGATSRSGSGTNASGTFQQGTSTIAWTVKDNASPQNVTTCTTVISVVNCVTKGATIEDGTVPPNNGETETVKNPKTQVLIPTNKLEAIAYPNPSDNYFNLKLKSQFQAGAEIEIRVFDISGKLMQTLKGSPEQTYRFGERYIAGTYVVELRQASERVMFKLIKQ
ncbi:MAG TPA: HYR domain-containing protein, partial [Chitinophagaceae bacterium]|nr:HYR domain-containing protein [Chitinophagaceae bacterium]